jgi:hypothetical protein
MVNNTAEDQRPFFMTANHCGVNLSNASSLVVYWNFQSPNCGDQGGGSLTQWQTGSVLRARFGGSDFTLVELDDEPSPDFQVTFAGWDRTSAVPTSAVTIHHPRTDEKSISFEFQPCTITSYYQYVSPGDGTHIQVADWDLGTTEPGSSGCPLFNQDHLVVGQLHGGLAACGNELPDWYGRFSRSWTGDGTSDSRLSDWLDPLSTGAETLDHLAPWARGLRVTPFDEFESAGPEGGPFTPLNISYTLKNREESDLQYQVSADVDWIDISFSSGTLVSGGTAFVIITLGEGANLLPSGLHQGTISFENLTNHSGDTTREVKLQVGSPELVFNWPLDTDPGWSREGLWEFGPPAGLGGQSSGGFGSPDPTEGYTGANVFGYNLQGNYPNGISAHHLTTGALDCSNLSGVTLKFWRWLGVQQSSSDVAAVAVSKDGVNFMTIWQNTSNIAGGQWVFQEFDISDLADGEPTVFIRWTMGPTDGLIAGCGWNIDDVELIAFRGSTPIVRTSLLPNFPNPFLPQMASETVIPFSLRQANRVSLTIYDLRGRLVKRLVDEIQLSQGSHNEFSWDGTDESGRGVSSGIYLYRLKAGRLTRMARLVLIR